MSPLVTLANAGTPLMWGACAWLVLGNIFIGILEWKLAAKRLGRPLSQGWFIVANYASAVCGFFAVDLVKQRFDLVLAGFAGLTAMWIGAFALTLLVEGVFFWLQVRTPGLPRKDFWQTLVIVNLATYAILFPASFLLGSTKMWREIRVVQVSDIESVPGWVYFLAPDKKAVLRVRLDGSKEEVVRRFSQAVDEAFVDPTLDGKQAMLVVNEVPSQPLGSGSQAAVLNVVGEWKEDRGRVVDPNSRPDRFAMYSMFGSYRSLYWPPSRDLRITNKFWGVLGLQIRDKDVDRLYALETPFASASWRHLTLLGPSTLLASLSGDIVLVDFRTSRIAKLARGSCPSVLVDPQVAKKRTEHWVTYEDWREASEPDKVDVPSE